VESGRRGAPQSEGAALTGAAHGVTAMSDALDLTPSVVADLIDRIEAAAGLLAWELPVASDLEHRMALDLARMRLLEGAVAIGELARRESCVLPQSPSAGAVGPWRAIDRLCRTCAVSFRPVSLL
jgi:hypothetical protein